MHKNNLLLPLVALALLGASASLNSVFAQASTTPAGYFTVTIPAGTGTSYSNSVLSFPLQGTASITGEAVGIITGVTSNTITNSNAGWTASQLSTAATPYLIQITSGTALGRTFLISTSTANTSTTVTIDPTDASLTNLTTLGINVGTDTYQIVPADTISSVFGTPATTGIQGGTSSAAADIVQLFSQPGGAWFSCYYNTSSNQWLQTGVVPKPSNNVVIRPDTGVLYQRLASTALTITLMGQVPVVNRQAVVSNTGNTFMSSNWPVSTLTLGTSNIQNISGWVSGTQSTADTVQVYNGSAWAQYYYNGSAWFQTGVVPVPGNNVALAAGSAYILLKKTPTSGTSILSQSIPYTP